MRGLVRLVRRMELAVVGVVGGGEEAAFGVGHLAEVVFDELGEVAGGLDVVEGAEGGGFGGGIAVGGGGGSGDGGVGALLAGGEGAG